ncbi:hypothetical protein U9M48_039548, partial [Paspalum notatum var. saurae]
HRTHFAYDGIHIDHGIEEQTQEQPLIEEPKDSEPDPQQEDQQQAADFAPEETDPSEEVWSSSSVLVLEEGPVIIRSEKRHELALE